MKVMHGKDTVFVQNITGFPDIMIYRTDILRDGLPAMEVVGFFDNDWTLAGDDLLRK